MCNDKVDLGTDVSGQADCEALVNDNLDQCGAGRFFIFSNTGSAATMRPALLELDIIEADKDCTNSVALGNSYPDAT